MIDIKNLTKSYIIWKKSVLILKWIDLKIKAWDFLAIMWPSGSWKSTLMNMIGILDIPSWWKYLFNNINVENFSEDEQSTFRRDKIGFVFQWYNLLPKLPAWEQVALPLWYKWWWYSKKYSRAKEVLKQVWLEDKIKHTPDMLSWWQQQRVCIARALACNPSVILADEPTWALDSETWKEVLKLFKILNKQWKTIIVITHDKDVASYANKTIHIKDWLINKIK